MYLPGGIGWRPKDRNAEARSIPREWPTDFQCPSKSLKRKSKSTRRGYSIGQRAPRSRLRRRVASSILLYHFQYMGDGKRWESMGSGDGAGLNPVKEALSDLSGLGDGSLSPGLYRYLTADGDIDSRWRFLTVSDTGRVRVDG